MTLEFATLDELTPSSDATRQTKNRNKTKKKKLPLRDTTCDLLQNMKHSHQKGGSVVQTYLNQNEHDNKEKEEGEEEEEDTGMFDVTSKSTYPYQSVRSLQPYQTNTIPNDTYDVEHFPGMMPSKPFDENHFVQGIIDDEFPYAQTVNEQPNIKNGHFIDDNCSISRKRKNRHLDSCQRQKLDRNRVFNNDSNTLVDKSMVESLELNSAHVNGKNGKEKASFYGLDDIIGDESEEADVIDEAGEFDISEGDEGDDRDEEEEFDVRDEGNGFDVRDEGNGSDVGDERNGFDEHNEENGYDVLDVLDEEDGYRGDKIKIYKGGQLIQSNIFDLILYLLSGMILIFCLEQILYIGTLFIKKI